jgi:hypothetical protein
MMSISQGLILDIVVIDYLLDLLMNSMKVIRHIYSLDAQSSNWRTTINSSTLEGFCPSMTSKGFSWVI